MEVQPNTSPPCWHEQSIEMTLVALNATELGLSEQESQKRLERYGLNRLAEPEKEVLLYASCSSFTTYSSMCYWVRLW